SGPKSSASKTCRISTSPLSHGAFFSHSIASWSDLHFHNQKPATSSFVSANGPSMTLDLPSPSNFTRTPFELGCKPSPASITPAFASSSLNLPMSASSFSLGMMPASEFLSAFTITMNRISSLLLIFWLSTVSRTSESWIDTLRENSFTLPAGLESPSPGELRSFRISQVEFFPQSRALRRDLSLQLRNNRRAAHVFLRTVRRSRVVYRHARARSWQSPLDVRDSPQHIDPLRLDPE